MFLLFHFVLKASTAYFSIASNSHLHTLYAFFFSFTIQKLWTQERQLEDPYILHYFIPFKSYSLLSCPFNWSMTLFNLLEIQALIGFFETIPEVEYLFMKCFVLILISQSNYWKTFDYTHIKIISNNWWIIWSVYTTKNNMRTILGKHLILFTIDI